MKSDPLAVVLNNMVKKVELVRELKSARCEDTCAIQYRFLQKLMNGLVNICSLSQSYESLRFHAQHGA